MTLFLGLVAALVGMLGARQAMALNACTAAQISSQDPGCPSGTGPCSITNNFDIATGCTLNFGNRVVTVTASGTLDIGSGVVTIIAGSFTIAPGGFVDGRGTSATPPNNVGATLTIQTTGNVNVQKTTPNGRLELDGDASGGNLLIDAGGDVRVDGRMTAESLTVIGGGGSITIRADGDLITGSAAVLSVAGGPDSFGGGALDVIAGGRIEFSNTVDAAGSCGGLVDLLAAEDIQAREIRALATGDAGDGGCVNLVAGSQVALQGDVLVNGSASSTDSGGGDGGFLCIEAKFGQISTVTGVSAETRGALPDGSGGEIFAYALGTINIPSGAMFSAKGEGIESCGGGVCIESLLDVSINGTVEVDGGFGAGDIDIGARRNLTIGGLIDARGRIAGSGGGLVILEGGRFDHAGNVTVSGTVDGSSGGCSPENGCGLGGLTEIVGCNVTIPSTGVVRVDGPDAGDNCLRARQQLVVQGQVNAQRTTTTGTNGTNGIDHRTGSPPSLGGSVLPSPVITALAPCTMSGQLNCLVPCPTCGNGTVEFPETCDTAGSPVSCDGCSAHCRVENCNDGNSCTVDSCNPTLGCNNVPVPGPCTPAPTPTNTRTPTVTSTPTYTATPSQTPTATPTVGAVLCSGGVTINDPFIKLIKLGSPTGDEKLLIKGRLAFAAGTPPTFSAVNNGAQVRIDDLGSGGSAAFELSHLTYAIPPGPGCQSKDGWKSNASQTTQIYKNKSGAVDAPVCTAGSANGFKLLKFKDKRASSEGIQFIGKSKNSTITSPVGPLRLTVVLGATAPFGAAGECGTHTFTSGDCDYNGSGKVLFCR